MRRITLVILMLLVTTVSYADLPPKANLVAHWKMNDNAANTTVAETRGPYNGTWTRNTSNDSVAGKISGALYSNALNRAVVLDNNVFTFSNGSNDLPFSVSFWANLDTFNLNDRLISKVNAPDGIPASEWGIAINSSSTILYFSSFDATDGGQRGRSVTSANVPIGSWIYVTATYNGSGLVGGFKIYINGVQKDSANVTSGAYTTMRNLGTNVVLGGDASGGAAYTFDGTLDDVRIYNIELTQTQIDSLYNGGLGTEDEESVSLGTILYNCTIRNALIAGG